MNRNMLWLIAEREMLRLGFDVSSKGFYYMVSAIIICFNCGKRKVSVYKEIYQKIADENFVSCSSVEKCIRNTIKTGWSKGDEELIKLAADHNIPTGKKPSNYEMISAITSRIRLERGGVFW